MNKIIAIVVLLIAATAIGYVTYFNTVNIDIDDDAPPILTEGVVRLQPTSGVVDFSLPDLDGNVHHISDWNGKARLINFWATWCAPCRREIPLLKKTQAAHAENNLQVIGIAVDFIEDVTPYAEDVKFNYPILIGQEEAMAAAEATGIDFIGMPFTMIVAPDGQLIKTHIGEIVEDDMKIIIRVFEQMQNGEIDLASARSALKTL